MPQLKTTGNKYDLSFVGLGKLGLPLAGLFGKKLKLLAIDRNSDLIKKLREKQLPFFEPGLDDLLNEAYDNVTYTTNYDDVVETDTTLILVNTPSKPDGGFSNEYIVDVLHQVCQRLKYKENPDHLFIISSTVMPRSIMDEFVPLIEKDTGWTLNKEFGVAHTPDFVALGKVIKDFQHPDTLIMGISDEVKYFDRLNQLYLNVTDKTPKVCSLTEAEIAKVSLNAYVTMKISFANFVGKLCEKYDDTDAVNVLDAIGGDRRISPYYLKPGLSFGGACFPRDTWAFIEFARRSGLDAVHIKAIQKINEEQDTLLKHKVVRNLYRTPEGRHDPKVSVLGLSFKTDTAVTEKSPAIELINRLLLEGVEIYAYDPLLNDEMKKAFPKSVHYCESTKECFEKTNTVVIMLPYKEFEEDITAIIDKDETEKCIIDCWRLLSPKDFTGKTTLLTIGKK